ncbi:Transcription initiation protein spt3 [Gonapodya sp. JEL0774]|nr:Transcription initiation protein spt3 [Gonapodya sp. JEL0774]
MFVFGETGDPNPETVRLIESIVRSQIVSTVRQALIQTHRRGGRALSVEDIVFLVRHDRAKVSRIRAYLGFKDVRKNAKDTSSSVDPNAADFGAGGGEETGAGPSASAPVPSFRKRRVKFSWDLLGPYQDVLGEDEDEDDEDMLQAYEEQIARLKKADDMTKVMTQEEYMYYSECRQASFTYKKLKRFRDWAGLTALNDGRSPEVVDILGFLAHEAVARITETAQTVRKEWNAAATGSGSTGNGKEDGPFQAPPEQEKPLEPAHVQEAYRRMQKVSMPMSLFRGGLVRTTLSLT